MLLRPIRRAFFQTHSPHAGKYPLRWSSNANFSSLISALRMSWHCNGYHALYGAPEFVKSIGVCVAPTLRSFNWREVNILCSICRNISEPIFNQERFINRECVHGWLPYFWTSVPRTWFQPQETRPQEALHTVETHRLGQPAEKRGTHAVTSIEQKWWIVIDSNSKSKHSKREQNAHHFGGTKISFSCCFEQLSTQF